ncbi:heme-binding domain-containing protein [uncultured Draconibacterium sp.]|uniref:heme-binding domain-containing protein n=1 Tax=uncultured Draconibacterium sp. TaxID=1573823 RepID=UPI003216C39A
MRKTLRLVGIILVLGLVILQFFQPEKNQEERTNKHIFEVEQVPANIQTVLSNACLDCHSNTTHYTWYNKIAPVSWMVNEHIVEGKDELNLSEWGDMDVFEKITKLEEVCQEAERKTMPLKSYRFIHPKAKLNEEQISELCDWTTKLSEELLAKAIADQ